MKLLTSHFVDRFAREFRKPITDVTDAAHKRLLEYDWPGNVRELRNVIERTLLLLDGGVLDAEAVQMISAPVRTDGFALPAGGVELHALERSLVLQAIERTGGNQTEAARLLGLHRDQLRYRLNKYGVLRPRRARSDDAA